jgi:hypothetical protein
LIRQWGCRWEWEVSSEEWKDGCERNWEWEWESMVSVCVIRMKRGCNVSLKEWIRLDVWVC